MENLRSLEPQAKISHSYKKKECISNKLSKALSSLEVIMSSDMSLRILPLRYMSAEQCLSF